MVSAYVRHGATSLAPGLERVGLYCPRCGRFSRAVEAGGADEAGEAGGSDRSGGDGPGWLGGAVRRYPGLAPAAAALAPHRRLVAGLYLFGSRTRGDEREGSDHDLLLIARGALPEGLKEHLAARGVQLECLTLRQANRQLALRPSFLLTALREAVPLTGAGLRERLLRRRVDGAALLRELGDSRRQLGRLRRLTGERMEAGAKAAVLYSAFLRLRSVHAVMTLALEGVPPLGEDSGRHYRGRLGRWWRLYRLVRDRPEDAEEADIPEEVRRLGRRELEAFVAGVDSYARESYRLLRRELAEGAGG